MKRRRFLSALGAAGATLGAGGCVALRSTSAGPGWRGAKSDHFDGRHFFNPRGPTGNTFGNLLKWQTDRAQRPWPARVENTARPQLPGRVGEGEAFVTLVNHCTFLIQLPGLTLLTDPVWSERVSPFSFTGPKRIRPPGLAWDALPKIDAVLISHSHFDHLDVPTLRELHARFRPKFVAGLGIRGLLAQRGIGDVEELDWWQRSSAGSLGAKIVFTPAQHWSARSFTERNTTLWGGFWIENARRKIYFAGDSGYCPDFADVRAKLGAPDLALLPIGAYEPRWFMGGMHMDPADAVRAHRDLGARRSLAMHFDAFPLADEGFGDAERELVIATERAGFAADIFRAPGTGETTGLG
jgi:L-ascorbate metabolism protein UlaG (beta-lactamase superfamily)